MEVDICAVSNPCLASVSLPRLQPLAGSKQRPSLHQFKQNKYYAWHPFQPRGPPLRWFKQNKSNSRRRARDCSTGSVFVLRSCLAESPRLMPFARVCFEQVLPVPQPQAVRLSSQKDVAQRLSGTFKRERVRKKTKQNMR